MRPRHSRDRSRHGPRPVMCPCGSSARSPAAWARAPRSTRPRRRS
jgi:hypothetical protein